MTGYLHHTVECQAALLMMGFQNICCRSTFQDDSRQSSDSKYIPLKGTFIVSDLMFSSLVHS